MIFQYIYIYSQTKSHLSQRYVIHEQQTAGTEEALFLPQLRRDAYHSQIQVIITTIQGEFVEHRSQLAIE